jgi:hypothetical protein
MLTIPTILYSYIYFTPTHTMYIELYTHTRHVYTYMHSGLQREQGHRHNVVDDNDLHSYVWEVSSLVPLINEA